MTTQAPIEPTQADRDLALKICKELRQIWKECGEKTVLDLGVLVSAITRYRTAAERPLLERAHKAEAKVERLREALRFYADPDNWLASMWLSPSPAVADRGKLARAALEGDGR
ncbi:hypothetical protein ACMT1E_04490 [Sphingomonas flavalba]|uniref:hypothetical protein n=1 Tax=Sphingomonas flavalba TaxID=2559804 RepID=UPI0039E0705B